MRGASNGAFDPTLRPLWRLYADHSDRMQSDCTGPDADKIDRTMASVGFDKVTMETDRIELQPGTALTLDGIAQVYIANRVATSCAPAASATR